MIRVPSRRLTVMTLCNTSEAPATLTEQISRVFLGLADESARVVAGPAQPSLMAFGAAQSPGDSTGARKRNDQLAQLAGSYYSRGARHADHDRGARGRARAFASTGR